MFRALPARLGGGPPTLPHACAPAATGPVPPTTAAAGDSANVARTAPFPVPTHGEAEENRRSGDPGPLAGASGGMGRDRSASPLEGQPTRERRRGWRRRREHPPIRLRRLATLSYGFEPPKPPFRGEGQLFLDPLNPQSDVSEALRDFVANMLANATEYRERLHRHYRMWKEVVDNPMHPDHRKVRSDLQDEPGFRPAFPKQETFRREGLKVGANDPCHAQVAGSTSAAAAREHPIGGRNAPTSEPLPPTHSGVERGGASPSWPDPYRLRGPVARGQSQGRRADVRPLQGAGALAAGAARLDGPAGALDRAVLEGARHGDDCRARVRAQEAVAMVPVHGIAG